MRDLQDTSRFLLGLSFYQRRVLFYLLISVGCGVMGSHPVQAQIVNGNFETGDFTNWTVGGNGSVEVLQQNDFVPVIVPAEGTFMALLSNGPGDVAGSFDEDFDENGDNDFDGSTLSTSFTITAVDQTLSFAWAFLTSEGGEPLPFDDLFDVLINGISIFNGSARKPGGVSTFLDTPAYDGVNYIVTSAGATSTSQFATGYTSFRTFCIRITQTGTYTLKFLIADQGDEVFDSGLLIDNVRAPSTCQDLIQVTDSAGTVTAVDSNEIVITQVDNQKPTTNLDASIQAFASTANYTLTNAEGRPQIFAADGSGFEQLTTLVSGSTANPAMTLNGRFVAFESTADLAPGSPGNADGNREIFRWNRTTNAMTQITDTTSCDNITPSIAGDTQGRFVAFVTTCTDLDAGFNADGSTEVVLWDENTAGYDHFDTIGCNNYQSVLGRDNNGRWVTFLSTCNVTGNNGDGNAEVVQWDRQTNTFQQLTISAAPHANDAISASLDGAFVSFLSTADYAGSNVDANFEIFRFNRAAASIEQITFTNPSKAHLSTNIDSTGRFIAFERFDQAALINNTRYIDTIFNQVRSVTLGNTEFPLMALEDNLPRVILRAREDYLGTNSDGNSEIWSGLATFPPPETITQCRRPNTAIPDRGDAIDILTIAQSSTIVDLDLSVDINHTFVGDLIVELRHETTGTTVNAIHRPGSPPGGGCSGDDLMVTLDDDEALPVENVCVTPGPISIKGSFQPTNALSAFNGEDPNGDWRLRVRDRRNRNIGTLSEWCLTITTD